MKTIMALCLGSLWNRRFVVFLTILSIAFSVFLVVGVERLRVSAKEGFARSAAGIDLIAAARGNPIQILMATVFGTGSTGPGIDWDSFTMIAALPQVDWAVPISTGDNHRGFPVIGTTADYFVHLRQSGVQLLEFSEGAAFSSPDEAVVGSEIAARFQYELGETIVNAHGSGEVAFDLHDEAPFTIAGILTPTGTAVDSMVLVSLEGFNRLHTDPKIELSDPLAIALDPKDHATAPAHEPDRRDLHSDHEMSEVNTDGAHDHGSDSTNRHGNDSGHEIDKINAIYVGLVDRGAVLSIQRLLSEYEAEPLTAVLPNVALLQLWSITSAAENALLLMASSVALAGIVGMIVMLSASLDARRREFAILRSVGATPTKIFVLVILEAAIVTTVGIAVGMLLLAAATAVIASVVASQYGLRLDCGIALHREVLLILTIFCAGPIAGIIPAARVYRMTLSDGLSFRL